MLVNNSAAFSVFDLWFGDAWIDGSEVIGNQVQTGSIWNFESFRGNFQQVCRLTTHQSDQNPPAPTPQQLRAAALCAIWAVLCTWPLLLG